MACQNCQRLADQRDAALKMAMAAREQEQTWREKFTSMLFRAEDAELDRQMLLGENAELRASSEGAE